METVEEIKYLAINFIKNSTMSNDVDRYYNSSFCQFNRSYQNLKFLDRNILMFFIFDIALWKRNAV